jgi:H+/Cl- antiporter ClcA
MIYLYYFCPVNVKRKKNIVSVVGFIAGMAGGIIIHHHAIGAALGITLGLALREIYD